MDKKEVKQIELTEVLIHYLRSGADCTGEWETNADIDFLLDQTFEFDVFHENYTIDRIKLMCGWDGVDLYYAANKEKIFHSFPVSKIFIKKVYDKLLIVQQEERFKNHAFEDDLMDMLRGERAVAHY